MAVCALNALAWKWIQRILSMINFAASLLLLLAVWRHTKNSHLTQIYALTGSVLFIVVFFYRLTLLIFRNLGHYKLGTRGRVMLIPKSSAILVVVPINRPFKIRPGSFLYLWVPGASFFAGLRTHPYQIAWWQTDHDGRLETVTCLIQNTNTFTRRLAGHFDSSLLVWIDGPYGNDLELDKYNQVLLVATGIGIASQLSYLRLLVEKSLPGKLSRDIFVAWEIEHPCKFLNDLNIYTTNRDHRSGPGVCTPMDERASFPRQRHICGWFDILKYFLGLLSFQNLQFGIYIPSTVEMARDAEPENWKSQHGRIYKIHGCINAEKVVPLNFWDFKGRSLITGKQIQLSNDDILTQFSVCKLQGQV